MSAVFPAPVLEAQLDGEELFAKVSRAMGHAEMRPEYVQRAFPLEAMMERFRLCVVPYGDGHWSAWRMGEDAILGRREGLGEHPWIAAARAVALIA